jgi:hypothetical protein
MSATNDAVPEPKKTGTTLIVAKFNGSTVAADAATSIFVAACVSAPISILDLSIMEKVAGVRDSMGAGIKQGLRTFFTDPAGFFVKDRPGQYYCLVYRVVVTVYAATFFAANVTRTWCEANGESREKTALKAGLASSFVNTAMTVWKDSVILRSLPLATAPPAGAAAAAKAGGAKVAAEGAKKAANYVPGLSRLGFAFRDTLTCIAAFTITPLLKDRLVEKGYTPDRAKTTASLATPVAMQFITTAVHIPSIVYQRQYNMDPGRVWGGPEGYSAAIVKQMKLDYIAALRLRMLRIGIAFGLTNILMGDVRLGLAERWGGKDAVARI